MNHIGRKKILCSFLFLGSCCNALEATDTTQFSGNQPTPKREDHGAHTPKQTVGPNMWNTPDPELLKISKRKSPEPLTPPDQKKQKTNK